MFYKQRDMRLYPAWAYTLPTTFLRVFYSATEAGVWSLIVYWAVGFAPEFSRCAVLLLCSGLYALPTQHAMTTE